VKNYVLGFMFDSYYRRVLLIAKNHPEWQKGRLNGIGGKIEDNESPMHAMEREFREETKGIFDSPDRIHAWQLFGRLTSGASGHEEEVWLFHAKISHPFDGRESCIETNGEITHIVDMEQLPYLINVVSSVHYLVQMACNSIRSLDKTELFEIKETIIPTP